MHKRRVGGRLDQDSRIQEDLNRAIYAKSLYTVRADNVASSVDRSTRFLFNYYY
jgi:hypothetical protein